MMDFVKSKFMLLAKNESRGAKDHFNVGVFAGIFTLANNITQLPIIVLFFEKLGDETIRVYLIHRLR